MTSPSRLSRESTTRSSTPAQKGHFMSGRRKTDGRRRPRLLSSPVSRLPSTVYGLLDGTAPAGQREEAQADQCDGHERRYPRDERDRRGRRAVDGEDVGQRDQDGDLVRPEASRRGYGKAQ